MELHGAKWYAGLDVHKDSIAVAVLERYAARPDLEVVKPYRVSAMKKVLERYHDDGEVVACYEAGPTGYGLARSLEEAGIHCAVLAPGKMARVPLERVKTDRRDAVKLARVLRSGEAVEVRIPSAEQEAVREYVRMCQEFRRRVAKFKLGLQALLLRQGWRYPGKTPWTREHWGWIRGLRPERPELAECISRRADALVWLQEQVRAMERRIKECAESPGFRDQVKRLRSLKGIGTYTAMALVSEVGDFRRFASAPAFMAFLGLVPSEHSSGGNRRTGGITKTGNSFLRSLLVEISWHYAIPERMSEKLRRKRRGVPAEIEAYAVRASERLHRVYDRLTYRRRNGKVAVIAVARELAGFIWGIMTEATA